MTFRATLAAALSGALALSAADPTAQATGSLKGRVRLSKDLGLQVDPLLRPYLSSDGGIGRGTAWLELCEDPACKRVAHSVQIPGLVDYVLSSGFPKDFTLPGLPAGTFHARVGLDTARSQAYASSYATDQAFGPFDLVLSQGADPRPSARANPPAATVQITLGGAQPVDLGTLVLGTLLLPDQAVPAPAEAGWLLAAASGSASYRNHVKIVDTATWKLAPPAVPQVAGADFQGDLCGFVRGEGSTLYVIGVGNDGARVFSFDVGKRAFASAAPLWIPHPDCKGGTCPASPSPTAYPWVCRGTTVKKGKKTFLYLVDFKGAGAQPTAGGMHLAVADVTGLAKGSASLVATYGVGASPWLTTKRVLRGIAAVGEKVFVVEPSWSRQLADDKLPHQTHVWAIPTLADGKLDLAARTPILGGTADDTCGSTNNWAPGFAVRGKGAAARLFLGNDRSISVFEPTGTKLGEIDVSAYGSLVTSFGLAPDGKRLYAMPNCKSSAAKARVKAGASGSKTVTLDRHATLVLDVSGSGVPGLLDTGRDLDGDGAADGGIDMEFLHHKAKLLRWCADCSGVVPPTAYTGPEIAVGQRTLFLRGTGIQGNGSSAISSAGLGQVGDVGLYDLGTGRGAVLRGHDVWTHGPSSRWGFDLDPSHAANDYSGDVSVAAVLFVPRRAR
ncbi:MAG: hypothetical protein IT376_09015 [Polyangiaceae bacterium]|nr:hypothetical protein [Polyangiaceae bacterium]